MMHAHVYYTAQSRVLAEGIREDLLLTHWSLFVGGLTDQPVGPHLQAQFEIHLNEEDLIKAVKHLNQVRKELSILVHKVTQNDFLDHTDNCFWLGLELELDFSKLDKAGENKAVNRFSLVEV